MTMHAERLYSLIGEFMNLVNACEAKGIEFGDVEGFTLHDCIETIDDSLEALGYDDEQIAAFWSGEYQLTSS